MKVPFHLPQRPAAATREAPATFRGVPVDRLRKAPVAPTPEPAPAPRAPPPAAPTAAAAAAPAAPAQVAVPEPPVELTHFWFVWCTDSRRPQKRHPTRESAEDEGRRLRELGRAALVYEAVLVETGEPQ